MAQFTPGDRPPKVHPGQAKQAHLLYMLALLPGCRHQQDHPHPDKSGILQRMRNMLTGMPGTGYNYGN